MVDEWGCVYLKIIVGDVFYFEMNWYIMVNWGDGMIDNYIVLSAFIVIFGFCSLG